MDPATIDLATRLIGNVGFPIFVATYLLLWIRPVLERLTNVIEGLRLELVHLRSQQGGQDYASTS